MTLSAKQERFVSEYLVDLNGTQAAVRAGYSRKTAQEQSARLLSNVMVSDAIAARRKAIAAKLEITQERVVEELAKIGFSDIRNVLSWKTAEVPVEVGEELEPQPHGGALKRKHAELQNVLLIKPSAEIDDITAASIAEISQTDKGAIRIKLHDKRAALVDLGKHLGMFKDQVKHTHEAGDSVIALMQAIDGRTRSK